MIIIMLLSYIFGTSVSIPFPVTALLVGVVGVLFYWRQKTKSRAKEKGLKEIPGPTGFPILGNVLQLGTKPQKQFNKWSDQYGDIYRVWLGKDMAIIISDPKMAKEIFSQDPAFTGRQQFPGLGIYREHDELGMFASEGDLWETHRRFLLRQLRDFGFGKSSMEHLILEEVNEVLDRYKKQCGQPVTKIRETLRLAVVNSLWKILSSERFEHDDPALLKLTLNSTEYELCIQC